MIFLISPYFTIGRWYSHNQRFDYTTKLLLFSEIGNKKPKKFSSLSCKKCLQVDEAYKHFFVYSVMSVPLLLLCGILYVSDYLLSLGNGLCYHTAIFVANNK